MTIPTLTALSLLLAGRAPAPSPEPIALQRFDATRVEMATTVRVVLYAPDETVARRATAAAFSRIRELSSVLSDYDPSSELSRLCRAGCGSAARPVSSDLWRVLDRADQIARASGGAFDITIGPVVELWRSARRIGVLPPAERLEAARSRVDYHLVELDHGRRAVKLLRAGVKLDLGGIAKGYAAREALAVLREHGLRRALVDVGGDLALGSPPPGARGWRVGLAPGMVAGRVAPHLWLAESAIATSGDREQSVVIGGRRYSHIVDPRTGIGLTDRSAVTVVAPDAMTADALASAVSVLGPVEGLRLVESVPGAAARIVRAIGGNEEVHESTRWGSLPCSFAEDPGGSGGGHAPEEEDVPEEGSEKAASTPAENGPLDLTVSPPVLWMRAPLPLPEADATTGADMRPYTERIPGTKAQFDMVPIRGGKFLMGSPPDEPNRSADEGPQHEVAIDPFWMGRCEVTWAEYELWGLGYDLEQRKEAKREPTAWDRLADAVTRPTKPYSDMTFGMGRDGYPAICMTQLAAKLYTKWLSAKTGRYYRLPTEAEWEYACRAGTTTAYSFGDDPAGAGDYAWYFENSQDKYHQVGQKKPNAWGLHDMHGNVAEWVLDRYTPDGYGVSGTVSTRCPLAMPVGIYPRVVRGGSWMDDPDRLRSAARMGSHEDWKMGDPQLPQSIYYHTEAVFVGFRVVRPLKAPAKDEALRYDLDDSQKAELRDYLEYLAGKH